MEKRKAARLKSIFQKLNNCWIFPVFFAVSFHCLIIEFNCVTGFIWLFSLIRLVRTGNRTFIFSGFLFSILSLVCVSSILVKERQETSDFQSIADASLQIRPDRVKIDGDYLQLEGELSFNGVERQVRADYYFNSEQELLYWQRNDQFLTLIVSGTLERPSERTNLHGFDYRKLLRSRQINQLLTIESIDEVEQGAAPWYDLLSLLASFRKRLLIYCEERFSETTATYCRILLFGDRNGDSELTDVFNELGILHLFSLSGMHVLFFFRFFRTSALRTGMLVEHYFWLQLLASFLFAALTGFPVSVLRALFQSNLSEANRRFQLGCSSLDIWSLTLFLATITQPFTLFSLAGQYSYFLSFFILFIPPMLKSVPFRILQQFCFSALLSVFTLPLLAVTSYEWQPVGIFLTFLLLPLFEYMLLPSLTFLFGASFLVNMNIVELLMEGFLQRLNEVFYWLGERNSFSVVIGHIPSFLFFSALFLVLLLVGSHMKSWRLSSLFLLFVFLFTNQKYLLQKGIVAFIDVGQGDSILLQAPFHQETILIDTGGRLGFAKEEWRQRKNQKSNAEYTVIPFLKSRGVSRLNKVFITHADADHMGDLLTLSNQIVVEQIYFPKGAEIDSYFAEVLRQMVQKGTKAYPILARQRIDSYFRLSVLAPSTQGKGKNNDSLVLHAKIADRSFLFTGDLEAEGEESLRRAYPEIPVDVLKVGHHGSNSSSSKTFIEQIKPAEAIISCGVNNRYGHPHEEVIETLLENSTDIFRTDKNGMIYYEWLPFGSLSAGKTILDSD